MIKNRKTEKKTHTDRERISTKMLSFRWFFFIEDRLTICAYDDVYKYSCMAVLTVCDHFYDYKSSYPNAKCLVHYNSFTEKWKWRTNIKIKILNIYICGGNRLKLYGSQNGNRIEPVWKASILGLDNIPCTNMYISVMKSVFFVRFSAFAF